jgi:hypothetical protein
MDWVELDLFFDRVGCDSVDNPARQASARPENGGAAAGITTPSLVSGVRATD